MSRSFHSCSRVMAALLSLLAVSLLLLLSLASATAATPGSPHSLWSPEPAAAPLATLRLHNLFSGNMTLARAPERAVMWGTATPGATISITVDGQKSGAAEVDAQGNFTVTLTTHPASVSSTLVVSDGSAELTLRNVAFGDVYFCSGQSNMQMPLDYSFGSAQEIASGADWPNVRLFSMAGNQYANAPLYESRLSYASGWVLPSPKTLQYAPNDVFNYFSGVCWYTGKELYRSINANRSGADVIPIGLIQGAYAGAGVVPFLSPSSANKCGYIPPSSQPTQQTTVIYNAMVAPYIKLRITAVLWYQGESDTGNTTRYACTFPALIEDWRERWRMPELPFFLVMLHPYNGGQGLADIRLVQKAATALPHTAIAAAIDLGDLGGPSGQIHPRNKSLVGHRLSLTIQQHLYHMDVVSAGPTMDRAGRSPFEVTVTSGQPTVVRVKVQFGEGRENAGLHALQTPNCTACCSGGMNLATARLLNVSANVLYYPIHTIDAAARSLTLTFTTSASVLPGQLIALAFEDNQWPQCVLYNDAQLPALPFRANAVIPSSSSSTPRHSHSLSPALLINPIDLVDAQQPPPSAANLTIDAAGAGLTISQDLYGVFFEEISHAGVGGLYSQAVFNSNFETSMRTFAPWTAAQTQGVRVELSLNTSMPLNPHSPHSLRVEAMGTGRREQAAMVGIVNPGFWGIHVPASAHSFSVSMFAYSPSGVGEVTVSLTSASGNVTYGSATLSGITSEWKQLRAAVATRTATADPHAVLRLTWAMPASGSAVIHFDIVTCFPQPGWRGLPFIRADIADMIAALHPGIFRMPGGGYVDGNTLAQRFAWNNSIGPLENRTGHSGSWGYYSEDGLGIYEYFSFAEKLTDVWGRQTRTVWVINAGISNAYGVPPEQLQPWIQSGLDCIEFITGNTSTPYGAIRADMGHPAPFKLDYLAIGNENCQFGGEPYYLKNFPLFYKAIKAAYPHLPLIANCNDDALKPFELWDFHTYPSPSGMFNMQHTFDHYEAGQPKIFVSEYASHGDGAGYGNLNGAIGEAAFMNGMERNAQVVQMASYAPFLGNINELNWHPNMIQYDSYRVYGTPSYYNALLYALSFEGIQNGTLHTALYTLTAAATMSVAVSGGPLTSLYGQTKNGSTSVFVLKLVNNAAAATPASVTMTELPTGTSFPAPADVATLRSASANVTQENSVVQPRLVAPMYSTLIISSASFTVTLPAYSITTLRVYTK